MTSIASPGDVDEVHPGPDRDHVRARHAWHAAELLRLRELLPDKGSSDRLHRYHCLFAALDAALDGPPDHGPRRVVFTGRTDAPAEIGYLTVLELVTALDTLHRAVDPADPAPPERPNPCGHCTDPATPDAARAAHRRELHRRLGAYLRRVADEGRAEDLLLRQHYEAARAALRAEPFDPVRACDAVWRYQCAVNR
jgi:hypothetical protein